jgi:hypothetical protein
MKRCFYIAAVSLLVIAMAACSVSPTPSAAPAVSPSAQPAPASAPPSAQQAIATASADELRAMIEGYKNEANQQLVYEAAVRLTELEPANASAYIDAADALKKMSESNYKEINRLIALGAQNAKGSLQAISDWAQKNQPKLAIDVPFAPDYDSPDEINKEGITTGNQTNAAKYGGKWAAAWSPGRGNGYTWQGRMRIAHYTRCARTAASISASGKTAALA